MELNMGKSSERIYACGNTFYGNRISEYGIENGRVDLYALSESFDCILCNNIMEATYDTTNWELFCGELEDEETENEKEIMQTFIVSDAGAELLKECGEIVFYSEELDLYVWGVTFYGVNWKDVLTPIQIKG